MTIFLYAGLAGALGLAGLPIKWLWKKKAYAKKSIKPALRLQHIIHKRKQRWFFAGQGVEIEDLSGRTYKGRIHNISADGVAVNDTFVDMLQIRSIQRVYRWRKKIFYSGTGVVGIAGLIFFLTLIGTALNLVQDPIIQDQMLSLGMQLAVGFVVLGIAAQLSGIAGWIAEAFQRYSSVFGWEYDIVYRNRGSKTN